MPSITINKITGDNIITKLEYNQDLTITGSSIDIPDGKTVTLVLDGKSIVSTPINEGFFSFIIPTDYEVNVEELYLKQLTNQAPYVIHFYVTDIINYPNISYDVAIFINVTETVMGIVEFMNGNGIDYLGLPQDGDAITAENANVGPIQNRNDLLLLDQKIGVIADMVDQKSDLYNPTIDNDLESPNANVVNAISQLRVDIGNKHLLTTRNKKSLTSAINELKNSLYKPSQALNLVADYDYSTNGNYVLSGGDFSFVKQLTASNLPTAKEIARVQPFQTVRYSGNFPTTSTLYNQYRLTASQIMMNGYKVRIPKAIDVYFQDTMTDEQTFHDVKYEDDMSVRKTSTDASWDYYRVPYVNTNLDGFYQILTIEGRKTYLHDFTFTTNGSSIQQLNVLLASEINTNDHILFSAVKLFSIPATLIVNGVSYAASISPNGDSIVWTNGTPPAGHACLITSGSIEYTGILQDDSLTSNAGIAATKNRFKIKNGISFVESSIRVSFNRILPRYDRIYMEVAHTNYDASYWSSTETYDRGDIVNYNGYSFKSLTDGNINKQPNTQPTNWENLGITSNDVSIKPRFIYVEGKNSIEGNPVAPSYKAPNALLMCTIINKYGFAPVIKNEYVKTYKMSDIKKLEDILNDSTYNLARLISTQNLSAADAGLTRNMYVAPFFTNAERDLTLELAHTGDGEASSMFMNNGILTSAIKFKEVNVSSLDEKVPYFQLNSVESNILVEQPIYTHSVLINKYQVATPAIAKLHVYPQNFTWYDEEVTNNYTERVATMNGASIDFANVSNLAKGTSYSNWEWRTNTVNWLRFSWSVNQYQRDVYSTKEYTTHRQEILSSIIKTPRPVPSYWLRVIADPKTFNGSEQLRVTLGDLKEIFGTNSLPLYANYDGGVDFSINLGGTNIPILSGDRELRVEGIGRPSDPTNDYISYARGITTVSQTPFLKTINNYDIIHRDVVKTTQTYNPDPLAQTFVMGKDAYIDSVYVMIDAMGDTITIENSELQENINNKLLNSVLPEDLEVTLFETTAGYPDNERVLATGILTKGSTVYQGTKDGTTAPQYNRIKLFPKVKLEKDKTYAFCVAGPYETYTRKLRSATDSAWDVTIGENGIRLKLRAAKLGYSYPYPGNKANVLMEQPYIDGVMLSSSNKITWNAEQTQDLTFKLTEALFSSSPRTINFNENTDSFTDVTDVIFQIGEILPENTYINHFVKYGTNLENSISIRNGEHKILTNKIASISRNKVSCVLGSKETPKNNTVTDSPMLYKDCSLYFGTVSPTSVYVTQNIDLTAGNVFSVDKKLRLLLDIFSTLETYDKNRIKVYYTTDEVITDTSWTQMYRNDAWVGVANEVQYQIGSGDSVIPLGNFLRIKVVLLTDLTNQVQINNRIGIENLRVFAL